VHADSTGAVAGPVTAQERIVSLDMLRGVAILGILVMNIYAFAMPFAAYQNPLLMGGTEIYNIGTWFFTHILFDQKFMSIFAMMFGAGLILMTDRAEQRGAKPARLYMRKQLWLLIIGALHGYLLWMGDILFTYALIGMFVYVFRKRTPRTLIIIACLLLPVAILMSFGNAKYASQLQVQAAEATEREAAGEQLDEETLELIAGWEAQRMFMAPTEEDVQKDVEAYLGGYVEVVRHRAPVVLSMQLFIPLVFGIWRVGALMLIGMAMMKLGVFTAERSAGFYRKLMFAGYLLGLPLTIFSAFNLYAHDFNSLYALGRGGVANYVGSILVALGHIGLVMLIIKTGMLQKLMARFAAVGRMALTNYLSHSLLLTTVFYGYGLGLYGSVPRLPQMGFVVAVIALQLWFSTWWLQRYRFGPVEWLWRSLTYWKKQPFRQADTTDRHRPR
jgi:uncharacterized protein